VADEKFPMGQPVWVRGLPGHRPEVPFLGQVLLREGTGYRVLTEAGTFRGVREDQMEAYDGAASTTVPVDRYVDLQDRLRDALHIIGVLVDRNDGSAFIHAREMAESTRYMIETSYDPDGNLTINVRPFRTGT
jgi:hypothetical protein